ncbi:MULTISPECIES: hypothetical protein [unclassified Pseudomonas]|uniref:hypothetical protein n=1 Tax=unclassified Pseudomonas TaxID=196821 RepID=UPI001C885858|nr:MULTISPECIES: hypothetical protein [unclassified Pseudomonas]MBX8470369.1 hypothetical protein [Pseudomonas sp. RIT778]UVM25207.1 hypothetical protein LOY31_17350 [Pseudomonas sp. B21-021]
MAIEDEAAAAIIGSEDEANPNEGLDDGDGVENGAPMNGASVEENGFPPSEIEGGNDVPGIFNGTVL